MQTLVLPDIHPSNVSASLQQALSSFIVPYFQRMLCPSSRTKAYPGDRQTKQVKRYPQSRWQSSGKSCMSMGQGKQLGGSEYHWHGDEVGLFGGQVESARGSILVHVPPVPGSNRQGDPSFPYKGNDNPPPFTPWWNRQRENLFPATLQVPVTEVNNVIPRELAVNDCQRMAFQCPERAARFFISCLRFVFRLVLALGPY